MSSGSSRVAGNSIRGFVLYARNVHHVEFIAEGFLLEVLKPGSRDFLEGSITQIL